jgi:hypothetical protein
LDVIPAKAGIQGFSDFVRRTKGRNSRKAGINRKKKGLVPCLRRNDILNQTKTTEVHPKTLDSSSFFLELTPMDSRRNG